MLRQLTASIAILIVLSHSPLASAEAWFEVEVYVFERKSQSTERWLMAPNTIQTNRVIDLISPVVGQTVASIGNETVPCTLVYDADANSHCAESNSIDANSPLKYRYPNMIPSEIGSSSQNYAAIGRGPILQPTHQGQFTNIINILSREPGNSSLLHITWQQPMVDKSDSVPIRLFAGKDFSQNYHFDGNQIVQNPLNSSKTTDTEATQSFPLTPSPVWQLDGTLNIYLSHYLYIETALNLRKEGRQLMSAQGNEANTTTTPAKVMTPYLISIPLEQNQRVKSNEIHYLDHPEMGMVLQIRKMAQPSA